MTTYRESQNETTQRTFPSIKLPLLIQERVHARSRLYVRGAWAATGVLVCIVIGWVLLRRTEPEKAAVGSGEHHSPLVKPDQNHAIAQTTKVSGTVGRVRTFGEALRNLGVSDVEILTIIQTFQGIFAFRTCKPEDTIVIERNFTRQIVGFEYRPSITRRYIAKLNAGGQLVGRKEDIPIIQKRAAKSGYIETTLGDALVKSGLKKSLVGTFAEAFSGSVAFANGAHPGDAFRAIVDERYLEQTFLGYGTIHAIEWAGVKHGKVRAYWFETEPGKGDYYDEQGRAVHGGWLRAPLRYDAVSSHYNPKRLHPTLKRVKPHLGVDYSAAIGTPVWAAASGVVTIAGKKGPNGNLVGIKHQNGYETRYAHLVRIAKGIKPGVKVKQRQVVGYVGSTGRSTGPHLHFGLKQKGSFIDPLPITMARGEPLAKPLMQRFAAHKRGLTNELSKIPLH